MSWVFRYDMTGMQWCLSNVWGGESERPSFRPSMAPWEIFSPFWVWGFESRSDVQMLGYQFWWPWYPILWVYDSGSTMVARKVPQASQKSQKPGPIWFPTGIFDISAWSSSNFSDCQQKQRERFPQDRFGYIWDVLRFVLQIEFCLSQTKRGFWIPFICLPWILRRQMVRLSNIQHFQSWPSTSSTHPKIWDFWIFLAYLDRQCGRAAPICRFPCNSRTARSLCLPMNDILGSFMESFPRSTWPLATSWNGDFAPAVGTEFFEPGDQMHWGDWSQLDSKETSTWKFWMKDNICHSWYLSINLLTYLNIHISLVILVHKFFEFRDFFAKLVRKRLPARPAPSCRGCFFFQDSGAAMTWFGFGPKLRTSLRL